MLLLTYFSVGAPVACDSHRVVGSGLSAVSYNLGGKFQRKDICKEWRGTLWILQVDSPGEARRTTEFCRELSLYAYVVFDLYPEKWIK